ncbi:MULTISPECIES: M20/M25/M40 family metallo-hydrolase [Listeria]|uniref:M20/M25/M40 family metallo-hydrolase n=1 Tax=Listeria TaxID=1637 RepID=UPI001FCA2E4D|nr:MULTISPECIES: M20/M25/M40 family metallo-hydrolase [Listeria]
MMAASDFFEELVKIYSPSYNEAEILDYIESELKKRNVQILVKSDDGIMARLDKTDEHFPALFFNAHVDTATNGEAPKLEKRNGVYTSENGFLGADDKAGVAVMLELIDTLQTNSEAKHGTLEFIFSAKEEVGMLGAKMLDLSVLTSRFGYSLDAPGEVGSFQIACESHVVLDFTIIQNFKKSQISAINVARTIIHKLKQVNLPPAVKHAVKQFEGAINENADETVFMKLELSGYMPLEELMPYMEEVKQLFFEAGIKYDVEIEGESHVTHPGFRLEERHHSVALLKRALNRLKWPVESVCFAGGSDASVFNERGLVTVLLSAGYQNPHSKEEQISENTLERLTELVLALALSGENLGETISFSKNL